VADASLTRQKAVTSEATPLISRTYHEYLTSRGGTWKGQKSGHAGGKENQHCGGVAFEVGN
jgi:hypothetical protein